MEFKETENGSVINNGNGIYCIDRRDKTVGLAQEFLTDLGFDQSQPTSIHSDNLRAITLSHDASYHARTKHINVAYHFIRERVASNEVALTYVRSKENPADLMTKALDLSQHRYLRNKLGY